MIGTMPTWRKYRSGESVHGTPRAYRLARGYYFKTDFGGGSAGHPAPDVITTRVVCDGSLVIRGRKVPTWTLAGAGILAAWFVWKG